ncbi:hypothetical protein A33M_0071 [Rhodovulum sp. PH10]|uniref:hypothetical protein n=1 Tax=Rhodovulum sp. PH10 TaxID=1187851 RepID=UPI00027C1D96|nr:hypothetical protein [Rhodovulum sp. PH10]EJW13214.1 hypothetical protein A33M_0071 [Rhodovulum sp. PH10]
MTIPVSELLPDGLVAHADAALAETTTGELKAQLLALIAGQDERRLGEKRSLFETRLAPYFHELSRRNPHPRAEDQVAAVVGTWTPVWSTIPFHDVLPGRIRDQSYQVFRDDGFYANMAHHVPGQGSALANFLSPVLKAYDLMVLQKFAVADGAWEIENVAVEVAVVPRDRDLSVEAARAWFEAVLEKKRPAFAATADVPDAQSLAPSLAPDLSELDAASAKKLGKTFRAKPIMENLYVDGDFRLIRSRREATQKPSYTIGIRRA